MNKYEKIRFVRSLCTSVEQDICKKIRENKTPDNWDGFELRHLLSEHFLHEDYFRHDPWKKENRSRIKDCNNIIIVNNL